MANIGFIGAGNMGFAMLKGAQKVFGENIVYTDVNVERLAFVKEATGLDYETSNQNVIDHSDVIVLAIKPQYMSQVLTGMKFTQNKILITIAPGITTKAVAREINHTARVVRAMPNTPALVGEGMSGVCYDNSEYSNEEKELVKAFFESFGKMVVLPESLMDVVVPVSGSSPAYVYMFIEAMADAGVLQGLPRQTAYEMAAQSVLGAAKMVLETKQHPAILKDAVCSPGGTTIEAVRTLEEKGLRTAVIEAMDRCYKKSQSFK